jgi:hypothetical protein
MRRRGSSLYQQRRAKARAKPLSLYPRKTRRKLKSSKWRISRRSLRMSSPPTERTRHSAPRMMKKRIKRTTMMTTMRKTKR